ncbi:MAG: histidine ammonia-lyase [Rhizobiales bacterium]|nr:histidine ammonia-lyase [Hyphomicrobiales bacterium]
MILTPKQVTLDQLEDIYRNQTAVKLNISCKAEIDYAAKRIADVANGNSAIYGVNTGFGKLASTSIDNADLTTLQRNLILSHCCGVGDTTNIAITRLMMSLKLISLGRGASGVRWELTQLLEAMLEHNITPTIPLQGSVGASGDLAPLAHMAAVMIGESTALVDGKLMSGREALESKGLTPIVLAAKEGLALVNGTQFSTANALAGLFEAWRSAQTAIVTSALTTDAIMGSTAPLQAQIHELRGHRGQIETAASISELLANSDIWGSHQEHCDRVQDPYCIRCQPQVLGACFDLLRHAAQTLLIESNAVTDNPLILREPDIIVSGGNFHAEPVAFAADQIAIAIAEMGSISQRRIALIVDPALNHNLPTFLSPRPGLNSGYMMADVTSAAIMCENKQIANPCSTDSTPTSANQEDHVSMAAHGAVRLHRMIRNVNYIIGIELLLGAQGVEFRAPLKTSQHLQDIIAHLRTKVPPLNDDRFVAPDVENAADIVTQGTIISTHITGINFPKLGA